MATRSFPGSGISNSFPAVSTIALATVTSSSGATVDSATRAGKTIYKFTSSGSITIGTAGTCEILVIGGGGGAGQGGGGGGGFLYYESTFLPSGSNTVTVGAGGLGSVNYGKRNGLNGQTSFLGSYMSPGGGGGADLSLSSSGYGSSGVGGASGGGGFRAGSNDNTINPVGGLALFGSSIGKAGYASTTGAGYSYGGGGGAGAAATSANGGNGSASSITGTSVTYCGGGGGYSEGTGGTGGGGAAGNPYGTHGTSNLGGGGGAGVGTASGVSGNGGSGYVVVVIG